MAPLNPTGLCACGCGQRTRLASQNYPQRGWVKGEPVKYLDGHAKTARSGAESSTWRGGRTTGIGGYVFVLLPPEHPLRCMADAYGYVREHRLVMAEHLGRPLDRDELVHHRNEIADDNRLENLQIVTHAEHRRIHAEMSTHCRYGHRWTPENTYMPPSGAPRRCRQCGHDRYLARRDGIPRSRTA